MDKPEMKVVPVDYVDVIATSGGQNTSFFTDFNAFKFIDTENNTSQAGIYQDEDGWSLTKGFVFINTTNNTYQGGKTYSTIREEVGNLTVYKGNEEFHIYDFLDWCADQDVTQTYNGVYVFQENSSFRYDSTIN